MGALGDLMVTRCRANSDGAIEYSKMSATSFKDSEAETEYGSEAAQNSNDGESSMNFPEEVAVMPENTTQSSQPQGNADTGSNLALYYCFPMVDNFAAHGQAWSYGQAYNQLTSYDPEAHWRQVCKDAKARPGKKQQGKKQRSRRGQGKRNKSISQDAPDTSAVEQAPLLAIKTLHPFLSWHLCQCSPCLVPRHGVIIRH